MVRGAPHLGLTSKLSGACETADGLSFATSHNGGLRNERSSATSLYYAIGIHHPAKRYRILLAFISHWGVLPGYRIDDSVSPILKPPAHRR